MGGYTPNGDNRFRVVVQSASEHQAAGGWIWSNRLSGSPLGGRAIRRVSCHRYLDAVFGGRLAMVEVS